MEALPPHTDDDFLNILEAIEALEESTNDILQQSNSLEQLAAESCYFVLKRSKGTISSLFSISQIEPFDILKKIDEFVDVFTNPDKVEKVKCLDYDDAYRIMVEWLIELVVYFGKDVLIDAEVIMLSIATFTALTPFSRYRYFESTLLKVRNWFKLLRKKLKPFTSPKLLKS
jgi:hypothetical protein